MIIGERELVFTDRFGRLMVSRVQMVRKTTIPPWTEVALSSRLTSHNHAPEGMVEGLSDKVVLGNSIIRPGTKGNVIVRCINPTNQPFESAASLTTWTFTNIDQQKVTEGEEKQPGSERRTSTISKVPDHLEAMFKKAYQGGVTKEQESRFTRYHAVFSQNDQNVKKADLVQHSIPVQDETRPITQRLSHMLGYQKE